MIKKVFLTIFKLAIFALFFLPVKQNWMILPVLAEISLSYEVDSSYSGADISPYLESLSDVSWDTTITNNDPVTRTGTLYATVEDSNYSSVSSGNWTVVSSKLLSYDYSLAPNTEEGIIWWGRLKDKCPNPINSVYSKVIKADDSTIYDEVWGYPTSNIYLTLRNQTSDTIWVDSFINGKPLWAGMEISPNGEVYKKWVYRGGILDFSIFSCLNSPYYTFNVSGTDPQATYSCSVADTSLINNCNSEHIATCTKITTTPTPTPGPGTPTPTPTQPSGECPVGCTWCTNPTDCTEEGVCTIGYTPPGACATAGDICCCCPPPPPGEGRISVNIKGPVHDVCEQITIEVYQEPDNSGSSACYYEGIDVNMNNPGGKLLPPDLVVCRAGNFKNSSASNDCDWGGDDGRCRTCIWDTSNVQNIPENGREKVKDLGVIEFPEGYYRADVYYGGHGDPGCEDSADSDTDDTTLVNVVGENPCGQNWPPRDDECTPPAVSVPVDISSLNPSFDSGLSPWVTVSGRPAVSWGWLGDCCVHNCKGGCICQSSADGTGFLGTRQDGLSCPERSDNQYIVSLNIPGLQVGGEYLVSALGMGTDIKKTGECVGETRPFMRLTSGRTTGYWKITDNISGEGAKCSNWGEDTLKIITGESSINVELRSKIVKRKSGRSFPAAFDDVKLFYCLPPVPPTCSVSGPTIVSVNTTVPYCAFTTEAPEGTEIWRSPTTSQEWTNVRPKGADGCSVTSFAQAGTYYVVCNAFGASIQCSGNPWCPWEPEALPEVSCDGWVDCGPSDDVLTVVVTLPDPWFQTKGGDVHAEGDMGSHTGGEIYSEIPSTAIDPYFSLKSDEDQSSVVSYTESADFGEGSISEDGEWEAKSSYQGDEYGYDYFYKLVGSPDPTTHDGKINQNELNSHLAASTDSIIFYEGNVETDSNWNLGATKAVILVSGKFLLNHRIVSDSGGSIVFVAKEGIGISKNVTANGEGNNIIRAVFITDKTFYSSVEPGDFPTFNTAESDKELVIDGAVIAWDNFNLRGRTFDDNATEPIELYRYDPAILLDSNQKLWQSSFTWQELAP